MKHHGNPNNLIKRLWVENFQCKRKGGRNKIPLIPIFGEIWGVMRIFRGKEMK
jgi:hypothetical protein